MVHISRLNDPLMNPRIMVGTFHVPMTISNLATGESATVDALVDTGVTLSVAPASLLTGLGIQPSSERAFELADGRFVTLPLGHVFITVKISRFLRSAFWPGGRHRNAWRGGAGNRGIYD